METRSQARQETRLKCRLGCAGQIVWLGLNLFGCRSNEWLEVELEADENPMRNRPMFGRVLVVGP